MWSFIEKHVHSFFVLLRIHTQLCVHAIFCSWNWRSTSCRPFWFICIANVNFAPYNPKKNALGNVSMVWRLCHNNRMYSDGEIWLLYCYLVNNDSVPDMTILTIEFYTCRRTKYHLLSPTPINTRVSSWLKPILLFTGIRYYRPRQVIHGRKIFAKFPLDDTHLSADLMFDTYSFLPDSRWQRLWWR